MSAADPALKHGTEAGGVVFEARDPRDFIEVAADFKIVWKGRPYEGVRLSRRHLLARAVADDAAAGPPPRALRDDEPGGLLLRVRLSGFILELEMTARRHLLPGAGALCRFDLTEIDRRNETALNQVVRSILRGVYPTADEFARPVDPETAPSRPGEAPARSRLPAYATIFVALVIILALLSFGGLTLYSDLSTIRATLAAVTAPRVDLFSTAGGVVREFAAPVGHAVTRDQLLFTIVSSELDADLETSRVRLRYFEAILGDDAPLPKDGAAASAAFQALDLPAAILPPTARYARDLELGVIKALETRKSALSFYSPCNCSVTWSVEPGATVKAGDRLLTLVKSGPDDLRIEALVDVDEAAAIRPGRKAYVEDPGTGARSLASVERVILDEGDPDRMGVPQALRRDPRYATVVLKAEGALGGMPIGSPLNVVIRK